MRKMLVGAVIAAIFAWGLREHGAIAPVLEAPALIGLRLAKPLQGAENLAATTLVTARCGAVTLFIFGPRI